MHATVLAYIGDAIYEVYIRKYVIDTGIVHADRLHTAAVRFVKASAQAKIMKLMFDGLPEEEQTLVKRARNRKPKTVPKNAEVLDYKWATAFEALLGYYYLTEQKTKLENAILIAINSVEGAI
jgi:ribonuclease-3 family protein